MLQATLSNELTKQTDRRPSIPPGLLCKLCRLQQNAHIIDIFHGNPWKLSIVVALSDQHDYQQ